MTDVDNDKTRCRHTIYRPQTHNPVIINNAQPFWTSVFYILSRFQTIDNMEIFF